MFVIMGATGQVGGAVLEPLKRRGALPCGRSRAIRSRAAPLGVEVVRGDASDAASLAAAFKGAEAAFVMLVPPPEAADVLAESRAVAHAIAAAVRAARVPHLVALSSVGAQLAVGQRHRAGAARFRGGAGRQPRPRSSSLRPELLHGELGGGAAGGAEAGVLPSAQRPLESKSEIGVGPGCRPHRGGAAVRAAPTGARASSTSRDRRNIRPVDAAAILSRLLGKTVTAIPIVARGDDRGIAWRQAWAPTARRRLADLDDAVNEGRIGFPTTAARSAAAP